MNRTSDGNFGGGHSILSMNLKSSLPPPPSPPSPRRRKTNPAMTSNQKKKFLNQMRVDMTGNLEHVPSQGEEVEHFEQTPLHQKYQPTKRQTKSILDNNSFSTATTTTTQQQSPYSPSAPSNEPPNSGLDTTATSSTAADPHQSLSSPSASLSKLSSVEERLANLLKEHPNNERALLLQKKINDRKAQASKRQQRIQNHLEAQEDPYKSAESLGSMTRLDIHGLYFKDGKSDETSGGTSTSSASSPSSSSSSTSTSSTPLSSPSPQSKSQTQTVSKLSPTVSSKQFGNNQSILRSGRYHSATDDGNKTALLGLIDSIEEKYNNNDLTSPLRKQRTKQPKKSKSWAGTDSDTVERGRDKSQQQDGHEGRSRSRSKRARSASRSRKSRSKSRTRSKSKTRSRSRSKSTSRKKKGNLAPDGKQISSVGGSRNKNPKYRRSRSLPPSPAEDVQDDLPRASSFHQPKYPPTSSSSVTSRYSKGSYMTDTRSVGADGCSSHYDGYDDSTVGSFHQQRRFHPKRWRLPLWSSHSSPSEGLSQSYRTASWIFVVSLLIIVGLVILVLWIVGVIEI